MRNGLTEKQDSIAKELDTMLELLAPQTKLPPERQLAEKFLVSRARVRDALGRLEAEGKVWRHVGQGTFVGQRPASQPSWRAFSASHTSPAEVLEVRILLEPQIAAVAAMRAADLQIVELRQLERKCSGAQSPETWEMWDSRFHRSLCEIAGNGLLLSIYEGVNAVRRSVGWTTLRTAVLTPERRERYAAQHREVVQAISARSSAAAYEAMANHIRLVSSDLVGPDGMKFPIQQEIRS